MKRFTAVSTHAAAALIGVVIGGTLGLTIDALTRPRVSNPAVDRSVEPSIEVHRLPRTPPSGDVLFTWSPAGLPARSERVIEALSGVVQATTVHAGLDWITRTESRSGTTIDAPPPGLAIPFEVASVEPEEYASFVSPSERDQILALEEGRILLAETSAGLRRGGEGLKIELTDERSLLVSGVIADETTGGYEAITTGPVPDAWDRVERFVIARLRDPSVRRRVEHAVRRLLPPGASARLRMQGEAPFMRYGDAVLPQLMVKESFGEFAGRPQPDGSLQVEDEWRKENIVSARIPLLGRAACHRALFPQLRSALAAIAAEGLGYAINREQFGGCYSPRFIGRDPSGKLSHHAWGIAVDVNVAENAPGTRPDQDERIVRIFEDHGFTWGGRWLVPDGMHFEWVRFP